MSTGDSGQGVIDRGASGPRLGYWRLLLINAFWGGNGAHWQPIYATLAPLGAYLVDPSQKVLLNGRATAAGGVFALLVPVLVGYYSDRTRTRFGRRRPWMVGGTIINIIGLFLIALAAGPLAFILCFLLIQAGNNVSGAAYAGIIPDIVPEEERGRASGLLGMLNSVGTVVGLAGVIVAAALFGNSRETLIVGYAYISVLLALTLAITCWASHEAAGSTLPPPAKGASVDRATWATATVGGAFVIALLVILSTGNVNGGLVAGTVIAALGTIACGLRSRVTRSLLRPLKERDFFWVFATRTLTQFGIFSVTPFIQFYFQDVAHAGSKSALETSLWLACVIGGGIIPAVVGGSLSDRWKRRKIFVYVSGGMQASALCVLLFGLVSSLPVLYLLGVIFGIGYGIYYAVDWALACDVLPKADDAGKDMGLWHISLTFPQVAAPALLAPVLFFFNQSGHNFLGVSTGDFIGYRVVFGSAALWFILGTVMIHQVKKVR